MTRRIAILMLTAHEPAVFSERAATEGAHKTLPCPTGSALLGWAAAQGPYEKFTDPFTIFHSGKVLFSNAFPLVDGNIAWPIPRLLMEEKHRKGGVDKGRLIADKLVVERPVKDESASGAKTPQYEALKGWFVTADGRAIKPEFGGRLRTATDEGRAKKGSLFGFQHIDPAKIRTYQATIEVEEDAVSDEDWKTLIDAFIGKSLRLGRGAGTAYGGYYKCEVRDNGTDFWPRAGAVNTSVPVRVWALSDLALVDCFGAPCFSPMAKMFGLPEGSEFLGAQSAMSVRRFAPWNAYLNRRDVERQVIEAGSVLSFDVTAASETKELKNLVGLWREAGLGRVWIAPPMLSVMRGEHPNISAWVAALPKYTQEKTSLAPGKPKNEAPKDKLVEWAVAMQAKARAKEEATKNGRAV